MTILILHGIQGYAGIHWQQWLCDNLVKDGHEVIMPTLPEADKPDRKSWLKKIRETIKDADSNDLVIVAHSLGVTAALDFIEQEPVKAIISVSGFARDYGLKLNSYYLKEREIDFNTVKENLRQAFVIYGDNDPYVPQEELEFLADKLGVEPEIIPAGGHLNASVGYREFPRLLEIIEKEIE
jgi:hypothetical protein